ncbi:protein of unknown function (DUF3328) domain containing protein [Rhypophila decipiens]
MALEYVVDKKADSEAVYRPMTTYTAEDDGIHSLEEGTTCSRSRPPIFTFTKAYIVFVHVLVLSLACLLFFPDHFDKLKSGFGPTLAPADGRTWSPFQKHIIYTTVSNVGLFSAHYDQDSQSSEFSGPPSPEQEKAWDRLLEPQFFAASREEMNRAGEAIIPNKTVEMLGDDDKYLAALGVFHELHCLSKVRRHLFFHDPATMPSLYHGDDETRNDKQGDLLRKHLYHCLDTIRASIMCQANPTMLSFQWTENIRNKAFPRSQSRSVCVDWNSVEQWGLSRMVNHYVTPVKWPYPRKHHEQEQENGSGPELILP